MVRWTFEEPEKILQNCSRQQAAIRIRGNKKSLLCEIKQK